MTPTGARMSKPRLPIAQLAILAVCRFSEPLVLTSVFPYLPEMIESFGVPQDEIPKWAGIISMSFSLAQAVTAIGWARLSDFMGRKPVIMLGLCCTMITSLLFGLSKTLSWAIITRVLAGAGNGNVGILRTMVAELVTEKELQPVAFSIVPMTWSLGSCFGPSIGGSLASPAQQYPDIFGGNLFLENFRFILPNLFAAAFFTISILVSFFFMKETMEGRRSRRDRGRELGKKMVGACRSRREKSPQETAEDQEVVAKRPDGVEPVRRPSTVPDAPTWAEVCTPQSTLHVLSYTLLAFHTVAFDQMIPVLLHLPTIDYSLNVGSISLPFKFIGGFGLESGRIGTLFTATGIISIFAQFFVFPRLAKSVGVLPLLQMSSAVFPLLYLLVPYCVLLDTTQTRQGAAFILMLMKALANCFAYPCITILLTNSARSVNVLGTLNGLAVSTGAIGRASGPFLGGSFFTYGVKRGYLVVPWFGLALMALSSQFLSYALKDLPGPTHKWDDDEEEDDEHQQDPTTPSVESQVIVLPSSSEAHSAQPVGVLASPLETRASAQPYFDEDEITLGEESPLLGGAGLPKTASGDSINVGGLTVTQTSSREDSRSLLHGQGSSRYGTSASSSSSSSSSRS